MEGSAQMLAELIILVANIWMNPMIFGDSVEEAHRKCMVFRQMMQGFELDIGDEEMLEQLQDQPILCIVHMD